MIVLLHGVFFALSAAVIWVFSGLLVGATDRVARRYNRPGFAVAFFILGMMTSVSELSVATNAAIEGVPQVSAGNLIGGSLVIFLLIIPLLAVVGRGIPINATLSPKTLVFLLVIVLLPSLLALDGGISRVEGAAMLLLYATLIYVVQSKKPAEQMLEQTVQDVGAELLATRAFFRHHRATAMDIVKIVFAGLAIFFAGNMLVEESVFFSGLLAIPASLVGLVLLSVGTNIPEIVITVRCVVGHRKEIAFGDYMGSAAANTPIMGVLALSNGAFALERSEFILTFFVLSAGLVLFFFFARSKREISRAEGIALLSLYVAFLCFQVGSAVLWITQW